jgi:hypothetical protein
LPHLRAAPTRQCSSWAAGSDHARKHAQAVACLTHMTTASNQHKESVSARFGWYVFNFVDGAHENADSVLTYGTFCGRAFAIVDAVRIQTGPCGDQRRARNRYRKTRRLKNVTFALETESPTCRHGACTTPLVFRMNFMKCTSTMYVCPKTCVTVWAVARNPNVPFHLHRTRAAAGHGVCHTDACSRDATYATIWDMARRQMSRTVREWTMEFLCRANARWPLLTARRRRFGVRMRSHLFEFARERRNRPRGPTSHK